MQYYTELNINAENPDLTINKHQINTLTRQHCFTAVLKMWTASQISNPAFDYRHQGFSVKILELERATHPPPA